MNKITLFAIVASAAGLAWLVSADFLVTGIALLAYGVYFLAILPKRLTIHNHRWARQTEAFNFMNSFVIALSVKNTPNGALESIQGQLSDGLKLEIEQADTIDTQAVIEHLKTYFQIPIYEMFVTLIELHTSQGGSILEMSELLLATGRRIETDHDEKMMIARRRLTNFVILWVLTIVVLLFSRFGISSLFVKMQDTMLFKLGIGMYFAFLLYAVNAWVTRFMQVDHHV